MKHIYKFNENTDNSIKEINSTEYLKFLRNKKTSRFNIKEINIIKDKLLQEKWNISYGKINKNIFSKILLINSTLSLEIDKFEDEWYLASYLASPSNKSEGTGPGSYKFYLCDQIEGVEKFISIVKNYINTNILPFKDINEEIIFTKNETIIEVSQDDINEFTESRTSLKFTKKEDITLNKHFKWIENMVKYYSYGYNIDDTMLFITIHGEKNRDMSIIIHKYDDDYFTIVFGDTYKSPNYFDEEGNQEEVWEDVDDSDRYFICDQIEGVIRFSEDFKYYINSFVLK